MIHLVLFIVNFVLWLNFRSDINLFAAAFCLAAALYTAGRQL